MPVNSKVELLFIKLPSRDLSDLTINHEKLSVYPSYRVKYVETFRILPSRYMESFCLSIQEGK
jgi:hypothetical protein